MDKGCGRKEPISSIFDFTWASILNQGVSSTNLHGAASLRNPAGPGDGAWAGRAGATGGRARNREGTGSAIWDRREAWTGGRIRVARKTGADG